MLTSYAFVFENVRKYISNDETFKTSLYFDSYKSSTVLKPVSCDHVISFNYDGKKARDVGLTC